MDAFLCFGTGNIHQLLPLTDPRVRNLNTPITPFFQIIYSVAVTGQINCRSLFWRQSCSNILRLQLPEQVRKSSIMWQMTGHAEGRSLSYRTESYRKLLLCKYYVACLLKSSSIAVISNFCFWYYIWAHSTSPSSKLCMEKSSRHQAMAGWEMLSLEGQWAEF